MFSNLAFTIPEKDSVHWVKYVVPDYITLEHPSQWTVDSAFEGCGDVTFAINADSVSFHFEICPIRFDKGKMDWVKDSLEWQGYHWQLLSDTTFGGFERVQLINESTDRFHFASRIKCDEFTIHIGYTAPEVDFNKYYPIILELVNSIEKI